MKTTFRIERKGERIIETELKYFGGTLIANEIFNQEAMNKVLYFGKVQGMPLKYENFLDGIAIIRSTMQFPSNLKHSEYKDKKRFLSSVYKDTAKLLGYDCLISVE